MSARSSNLTHESLNGEAKMRKSEIMAVIANGENAKTEFKRDDARPEQLAREIVSFANMNGGRILLGVEDDGAVSGVQRADLQAWLMDTVIGRYVTPQIIPDYAEVAMDDGTVAVVDVPLGAAKPYAVRRGDKLDYYLRLGNTCQLASREQLARLFESGGLVSVEKMPVHGGGMDELDMRRLREYFQDILGEEESADWQRKLLHRDLLAPANGGAETVYCSFAAYALFALQPKRRLPQAGLRLLVFPGADMDYDAHLDEVLDIPFVGLGKQQRDRFIEQSLPNRALSYLQPHISEEKLTDMTRQRHWDYPPEVIRELLVNAFAHRDWTKQNDARLTVYNDRMEITSPGALPNGMTVDKIMEGQQSPRNTNMVRILRDYGLMDDRGMGIRRKVIPLMREHNDSAPGFDAAADYFKVTLWKRTT